MSTYNMEQNPQKYRIVVPYESRVVVYRNPYQVPMNTNGVRFPIIVSGNLKNVSNISEEEQ